MTLLFTLEASRYGLGTVSLEVTFLFAVQAGFLGFGVGLELYLSLTLLLRTVALNVSPFATSVACWCLLATCVVIRPQGAMAPFAMVVTVPCKVTAVVTFVAYHVRVWEKRGHVESKTRKAGHAREKKEGTEGGSTGASEKRGQEKEKTKDIGGEFKGQG